MPAGLVPRAEWGQTRGIVKVSEHPTSVQKCRADPRLGHPIHRWKGSDSSSFIAKKIPAVTLSGLSNEWQSILHTPFDQVKKVNSDSVYLGYRLALAMWSRIEEAPCESFR